MTATIINTQTTPTADAIQEALAFLKNLSEKNATESGEKPESFFSSDVFKTIEAALRNSAEAKAVSENGEESSEDEAENVREKKQAAFTASQDTDEDEEEDADTEDDDEEEDEEDEDDYEENNDGWDIGDVLAIGAGVALGAAVVYGGIKLGKAIFSD